MSFSHPNYQPPQQPGYPPQHPSAQYYGNPSQHYAPPTAAPQPGYAPHIQPLAPPHHPQVAVDVHQQYAQPVQQGNSLNQPLFSPSQLAMDSSSPAHQLDGSVEARMAGASGLRGLRDRWWLLLFALHLGMLFIVEGVFGHSLVSDWNDNNIETSGDISKAGWNVIGMLVVSAVIGVVFSALWLKCIQWVKGRVVMVSLCTNVCLTLATVVVCFNSGNGRGAVPHIVWIVGVSIWVFCNRNHIPLAEATLAAASKSLSDNWGPVLVAYGVAIFQVGWHLNAAFTFYSVLYVRYWQPHFTGDRCSSTGAPSGTRYCSYGDGATAWSGFAMWYTVISFYWTAQVIRNIAHFTTAGTVSSWWLVSEMQTPTWGALKRACTTSLGTITVGSLLVAVVEFLRGFTKCLSCCCGWVQLLLRWFNRYAFIISAMYGSTYFEAAKHVSSLMHARFWELLVNDSLTSAVFWMGSVLGGTVAGIVGAGWGYSEFGQDSFVAYIFLLVCFIIGFNVASLFMAVMDSAVVTTLVVWAENPQSMHRNRPEHHDMIAAAAQQAYPTEFAQVFVPVQQQVVYVPVLAAVQYNQQPPAYLQPNAPPAY